MRRVFGPRTFVEAAFVVAVPFTAAVLGEGAWTIIAASAVGYLLIFVVEALISRGEGARAVGGLRLPSRARRAAKAAAAAPVTPEPQKTVVVQPPAAAPAAPAPDPVAAAPVPVEDRAHDHVRVLPRAPEEPPAPEPEAAEPEPVVERAPLAAVPEPEPVAAEPEREPQTVVPIGVSAAPRQWNLWELERLTRERAGHEPAVDEERQFLLMYLREFADSDGMLPIDFDNLVRDSFGELVGAR